MKSELIKTLVLASAIGLMACTANAQSSEKEPIAVTTAFSSRYPGATSAHWKMKNDTSIAMFNMDKRHYKAFYLSDGTWLRTERNVKRLSTLPMQAQVYLKNSKYASWHIDNLAKVQTPTRNVYMVQLDNHSGNVSYENTGADDTENLYFNNNGRLIGAKLQ